MEKIRMHIQLTGLEQSNILQVAKHFSTGPRLFSDAAADDIDWAKHLKRKVTLLRLVSSSLVRADADKSPKVKHYTDGIHYFLGSDTEGQIAIVIADDSAEFNDYIIYDGTLRGLRTWLTTCGFQRENFPVPLHENALHLKLPVWADYFESLDETAVRLAQQGDSSAIHQMISTYIDVYNKGSVIEQEDYQRAWGVLLEAHPALGQAFLDRLQERNKAQTSLNTISAIAKELSKTLTV